MEFWFVHFLEGCSISFIFVNLKNTDKGYKSIRSKTPVELINNKILKEQQTVITRMISKQRNLI